MQATGDEPTTMRTASVLEEPLRTSVSAQNYFKDQQRDLRSLVLGDVQRNAARAD